MGWVWGGVQRHPAIADAVGRFCDRLPQAIVRGTLHQALATMARATSDDDRRAAAYAVLRRACKGYGSVLAEELILPLALVGLTDRAAAVRKACDGALAGTSTFTP